MGGLVSSNKSVSDDRKVIRKDEEEIAGRHDDANEGILTGDLKKDVRWYHWLIYDMRFRILYSTILGLGLGIGLPVLIYLLAFNSAERPTFGSCLINPEYRFECLINSDQVRTEDDCYEALCCWVNDDSLPFKCHHSVPPGYQYEVADVSPPETSPLELSLSPQGSPTLTPLKVKLEKRGEDHLEVYFYKPGSVRDEEDEVVESDLEGGPLTVTYAAQSEFFFIHLQRITNTSKETIFDTRLGPVISTSDSLSFSTVLPSEFFWGLKGGQGDGPTTVTAVNGPQSHELPFYMAMEASGSFHGVLIETSSPFLFQFISAPGALFHFQTKSGVRLHFFPGPTPADVYKQVDKFQTQRSEDGGGGGSNHTSLPPYWAMGLHLCRKGLNASETIDELWKLADEGIPYDSDCVDENFRRPFAVDEHNFPPAGLDFIFAHLEEFGRKVLLSQKMGWEGGWDGVPLILNQGGAPLVGTSTDYGEPVHVVYPDYFNRDALRWVTAQLNSTFENDFNETQLRLLSGLVLVDNFPSTVNSSLLCGESSGIGTRLGSAFTQLDLICANGRHMNTSLTEYGETSHLSVHNVFGQESLRILRQALEVTLETSGERVPLVGVSVWTGLGIQDGFGGVQVPFTWNGLFQSLSHVLRNFVLNPVMVGTPICGSFPAEAEEPVSAGTGIQENGDVLCLRWFQLGLLLPFARNRRDALNGIRGPLDMSLKFRTYVAASVRTRYRLNPYYYTRLYERELETEPFIRPLIFDFHSDHADLNATRTLLSQFMIGAALMATPILSEAISREVYFPSGKWYDLHGTLLVNATQGGRTLTVPSIISEISVYIRGGHIIPTLDEFGGNSAVETRGGKYRILGTFPDDDSEVSSGSLYVDDGISVDSISSAEFNYVTFTGTTRNFSIHAGDCGLEADSGISTIIDEIRILGFWNPLNVDKIEADPTFEGFDPEGFEADGADEEIQTIRMTNLNLDWCQIKDVTFTWIYKQ